MIGMIVLLVLAFVLLAFFEGSEMAFLSSNKLKVRHLADNGNRSAAIVRRFQRDPQRILTTILVGTNIAHVMVASLFAYMMQAHAGIDEEWIVTLLLVPFIIIFAETVPKDWFRQRADDFIYRIAPVLLFFEKILKPVSFSISFLVGFLVGFMERSERRNPFVTKEEFRSIVDESARGGVLGEHEKQLIHTILDLGSTSVGDVMVRLKEYPHIELSKKVSDAKVLARQTKKSLVLVYEEIPSIVVGVLYVFDILFEDDPDAGLGRYLRSPLFVSQSASVEKTITLLQSKHSSYAVVTNDKLEVVGVAAIENLIRF